MEAPIGIKLMDSQHSIWALKGSPALLTVVSIAIALSLISASADELPAGGQQATKLDSFQASGQQRAPAVKMALEEELESIIRQHDGTGEGSDKRLAEDIISRLLVDNLTSGEPILAFESNPGEAEPALGDELADELAAADGQQATTLSGPTGLEAMRVRKLLSMLHNYETNGAFPMLPNGQAATMKRAMKMGSYLKQQQRGYGRNAFDFGLGKRPDSGAGASVLRFGDLSLASGGQVQPVSQFGKRPSAHRYDFGLGKRVASPTYPRYDFGLGKRAPNYLRYDFGLGK